ncbi:DsbA family protein [Salinigranum sp. GCM10025319]|uniref:DsbA family protein n=1 Tax=Salinigranum sp. GCM10025319 TaxID=3252687 RepID=UPI00361DDF78
MRQTRRRFLATAGLAAAGVGSVAGCTGRTGSAASAGDGGDGETSTGESMGGETGTASGGSADGTGSGGDETLAGHPAAQGLDGQPTLGTAEATATIIAFEDPSCPRCRAFERNTVPQLRSELVDTGQARFVARTYPVIYPWGEPAVHALEATFARSPEAFWGLFAHYFAEQDSFSTENVLARTEEWLAANTDLDGASVVADAEAEAYAEEVQADLDAGEAANVGRTTPTVFLFRDGEYVTRAGGSVSFDLISSALGL